MTFRVFKKIHSNILHSTTLESCFHTTHIIINHKKQQVFQDLRRNVKLPTMDASAPTSSSKITLAATWRIAHHIHVFCSVSRACRKNRASSTAIWNAVASNMLALLQTLHSVWSPNLTLAKDVRQCLTMLSPETTVSTLGISPGDKRMKIMQSQALPRETAISRVISKLHEYIYLCMALYVLILSLRCKSQTLSLQVSNTIYIQYTQIRGPIHPQQRYIAYASRRNVSKRRIHVGLSIERAADLFRGTRACVSSQQVQQEQKQHFISNRYSVTPKNCYEMFDSI